MTEKQVTSGCLIIYGVMALIVFGVIAPWPFNIILAVAVTLVYAGLVAICGHGSVIEMGIVALILLVLCGIIGPVFRVKSPKKVNVPKMGQIAPQSRVVQSVGKSIATWKCIVCKRR